MSAGRGSIKVLPILAFLLLSCVEEKHAIWWVGDVAGDSDGCHVVTGNHAVIDRLSFRGSVVLPFAWGGYRLFVVTRPDLLQEGAILQLPSPETKGILCSLSHGASREPSADIVGSIEVLDRHGFDLRLRVEIRHPDGEWLTRDDRWYQRQGAPIGAQ